MEVIIKGTLAFVSMNIDDIFVLLLIYSNANYRMREVVVGQYLGTILLFSTGFLFSFLDILVPKEYIGLLGWIPFCIGLKAALGEVINSNAIQIPKRKTALNAVVATAAIIIANGSNNAGAYIPLFSHMALSAKIALYVVFIFLAVVWCYIPLALSRHPGMVKVLKRYGKIVHPLGLVILGLYILFTNGTYVAFFRL